MTYAEILHNEYKADLEKEIGENIIASIKDKIRKLFTDGIFEVDFSFAEYPKEDGIYPSNMFYAIYDWLRCEGFKVTCEERHTINANLFH